MKRNIAIFASGSGSNAENLIRYFQENERFRVTLVLTDRADAFVIERAQRLHVPCQYLPATVWREGTEVMELLASHDICFVVLAGFLRRVPDSILQAFPERIVNIHPSLLPKYGGKGMYGDHVHRAVVAAGEAQSGITIHHVNEHYDEGAIIFQATCPVAPCDTPEAVAQKVHVLEYEHFPPVVEAQLIKAFPL